MKVSASSPHYLPILARYPKRLSGDSTSTWEPRNIVMYGSRLSAKTTMMGTKLFLKMESDPYCSIVAIRKIYAKCKDSIYAEIKDAVERNGCADHYQFKVSPLEIINTRNGNKCIFRGLDDPQALKGLKEVNVLAIDEANEITEADFIASNLSIRTSKKDVKLLTIMCFNPEVNGKFDWLERYWFPFDRKSYEKEDGSHTYIKSRVPDTILMHSCALHHNDYLSDESRASLEYMKSYGLDSNYYLVNVIGAWGHALVDRVFTNIEFGSWFPSRDECKNYAYGLDFGFKDVTSLCRAALYNGEIYAQELIYKSGLTNTGPRSIVSEMDRLGIERDVPIWCDQADPKSIEAIYRSGYNAKKADKGKGSILAGIACMQGYKINLINSPNAEKEAMLYVYDRDKEGNSIPTRPIDAHNHFWDSLRYHIRMELMTPKKKFNAFVV